MAGQIAMALGFGQMKRGRSVPVSHSGLTDCQTGLMNILIDLNSWRETTPSRLAGRRVGLDPTFLFIHWPAKGEPQRGARKRLSHSNVTQRLPTNDFQVISWPDPLLRLRAAAGFVQDRPSFVGSNIIDSGRVGKLPK